MALIFDLDGTLIDSLPGIAVSLNHALRERSLPEHPQEAVRRFVGDGSLQLVKRALPEGSNDSLARDIEAAFKEHYRETWADGTTIYDGIPALLESLSGRRVAVLSNKHDAFTKEIVRRLFPEVPFSPVTGLTDDIARKPAPDGALRILKEWRIEAAEARFIGDSAVDRTTAENAGIPFVAVGWGYEDPGKLGPVIAADTDALRDMLA